MKIPLRHAPLQLFLGLLFSSCVGASWAQDESDSPSAASASKKPVLDRSGEPREGKASYYSEYFYGRTMADGTPMDPDANIAASRTLPLGSIVEVTNLENGKSEIVEIRDRGPYIDGRIIDLSPKVAKDLDMLEDGVVEVVVTPIEVPGARDAVATGSSSSQKTASGK